MAFDIEYFLKINNTYGTTNQKDTQLYNLKSQINDRFTDTIDCYKVKVNNVDRDLLIVRTIKQDEKTIKSRPDEDFYIGDYVVFDNKTWMVISKDECNQTYTTGTMRLTNYIIKFQSPSGTILSYPCIDETTNSVGVDENNTINTINGIHRIIIPYDDNTKLITISKRFFVDKYGKTTCKTTHVNNTSFNYGNKGLIILTLQEDSAYNFTTDINGVCNYFEPTTPPEEPEEGVTYSIITTSGQLAIDKTRTVTATAYNADGSVNNSVSLVWVITKPTGFESDITCTIVGNTCTVEIVENYDLIDLIIEFEVSNGSSQYIGNKEFVIGV